MEIRVRVGMICKLFFMWMLVGSLVEGKNLVERVNEDWFDSGEGTKLEDKKAKKHELSWECKVTYGRVYI